MIESSEYIFLNPKLEEIIDVIDSTMLENKKMYSDNYYRQINFKYNIQIFEEKKNSTVRSSKISETKIASQAIYEYIKINKLIILKEGSISKNVINTYMKCDNIPRLWIIFSEIIASKRDYIDKFCNGPFRFDRFCCEWYLHNLIKKQH